MDKLLNNFPRVMDDGYYLSASMTNPGNGDFLLNVWFYINILWYLAYCSFISSITFSKKVDPDYTKYRDLCI